jgi:predicted house-cleaning noncanonical NTP pyrophosphatase (MazG superfamily)
MPKTHVADEAEYWEKLKEKLGEEVREFCDVENVEELADIFEVLDVIIEHKRFDRNEIETVKGRKAEERGRFRERIILEES